MILYVRKRELPKKTISDEALDALLAGLAETGDETSAPPVVNLYRLEKEKERRRSDRQLRMTAAAAVASMLLSLAAFLLLLREMALYRNEILRLPAVAELLEQWRVFESAYGEGIGAALAVAAAAALAGYVLCAALLLKNRDRIPLLRGESR